MALEILLPGVYLASIAVESLLFGVFVVLSFTSLYLLFARERLSDRPKNSKLAALTTPLIFANVLISATVTAVSLPWPRAFVDLPNSAHRTYSIGS